MKFQVQQVDNDRDVCGDCEDCSAGEYGDCINVCYRPTFLYAKDVVTVRKVPKDIAETVRRALVASSVTRESDRIYEFEILAGGDDCLDPYDLSNATSFDVLEDYRGPYRYIVTVL